MSAIIDIDGVRGLAPVGRNLPTVSTAPQRAVPATEIDRVELSPMGREFAKILESSSMRRARANAIRSQIENHTYETPERINGTVDRLIDLIG